MLEWVCPQCDRAVDPAFDVCPFCGNREVAAAPTLPARARPGVGKGKAGGSRWADVERGFRFGLGFVAVLALAYFLLVLVAYFQGNDELFYRLTRWLHLR